jgi:P-type Ca2+ transporter type 2C
VSHGRNELGQKEEVRAWRALGRQFKSPLVYVLLVALALTVTIQHWADAIAIGIVLAINANGRGERSERHGHHR